MMAYRGRAVAWMVVVFLAALCAPLRAQRSEEIPAAYDDGIPGICEKCAAPHPWLSQWLAPQVEHWGYGYADLLADLVRWSSSGRAAIDSIGASVQGRALWQTTITAPGPADGRHRIFIHARTHPGEVQALRVANAMVAILLSDDPLATALREHAIFHIVPMYNPDGVELDLPRENAHEVDLERGWDTDPALMEPEVATLRRRFIELMATPNPIELALNLHSAGLCRRYFVFHDTVGTSAAYTAIEQRFIDGVQARFPDGIEPWDFYRSWTDSTPPLFPESWWWRNHGTNVLALTYEDMNCSSAGMYDSTAGAILQGIASYFGIGTLSAVRTAETPRASQATLSVAPNPVVDAASIRYRLPIPGSVTITIHDLLGRLVARPVDDDEMEGEHEVRWFARGTAPGVYLCTLRFNRTIITRSITVAP